ncbi:uncharacterized protein LOC133284491 [Gastrolobium bilobum]|uniref:uncharacterized protein LOC133284491 n=1 Tax=Gastrolobium bilobum TaxID=150636 RepID=UPI002AB2D537|nr:uncharacterized protein LOC133284491 [Gastrolobium bilobum]
MQMNSKSKPTSIRVFGQRTIASSFGSLPCNPSNDSEGSVRNQASKKSQSKHVSLSHFLDRRLPKPSLLPQTVPGTSTPFLSPLSLRVPKGEEGGAVKQVEEERKDVGDEKVIFERFKHTEDEKEDFVSPFGVDELENSVADDIQESKKRKNPFQAGNENQTVREHVVVLGGESKLKPKGQIENNSSNKKPRPLYNHYANGRGWWDYDMEGVDNEELGFNEVWEGVGSTSLGGIVDWH